RRLNYGALVGLVVVPSLRRFPPGLEYLGDGMAVLFAGLWAGLIFKLAGTLGLNRWWWVVKGFIPVLNLFVLLQLSRRSNAVLREAGIEVGLLGASLPERPPDSFREPAPP